MAGWTGKILRVDLSSGQTSDVDTKPYEKFMGGLGIADKIHFDEVAPTVTDPFDPANTLVLMTGPVTGTLFPSSGRMGISGIGPGTYPKPEYMYSEFGDYFGPELKYAGYDGVILQGKASSPAYVWIHDGTAELKDAKDVWGLDTLMAQDKLKAIHGQDVEILCIGPAGENMTRQSTLESGNATTGGYGGFGAVWGAKNLKAMVVSGTGGIDVVDPKALLELRQYTRDLLYPSYYAKAADRPLEMGFANSQDDDPDVRVYRLAACQGCAVGGCKNWVDYPDITHGHIRCAASSIYSKYDIALNKTVTPITKYFSIMCNRLGLDTRDVSYLMTWLSNSFNAKALTEQDTGLPLSEMGTRRFADEFLNAIAYRKGFGNIMAEGVKRAVDTVGKGTDKYYPIMSLTKWGTFCSYDPQKHPVSALLYSFESRTPIGNGLHTNNFNISRAAGLEGNDIPFWLKGAQDSAPLTPAQRVALAEKYWGSAEAADQTTFKGKAAAAIFIHRTNYIKNSLTTCDWIFPILQSQTTADGLGADPFYIESAGYSAVTGNSVSPDEMAKIGDRVFLMHHATLMLRGRTKEDYLLGDQWYSRSSYAPPRSVDVTGPGGQTVKLQGQVVDKAGHLASIAEFVSLKGWDANSQMPTRKNFEDLDMKDVADKLAAAGKLPG